MLVEFEIQLHDIKNKLRKSDLNCLTFLQFLAGQMNFVLFRLSWYNARNQGAIIGSICNLFVANGQVGLRAGRNIGNVNNC